MKILYLPSWKSQQRQFQKKDVRIFPIRLAMEATWHRDRGDDVVWGLDYPVTFFPPGEILVISEPEGIDFLKLPSPDRLLTEAFDKRYQKNGNFKHLPGAYTLAAQGCWYGKCKFCVERKSKYVCRSVNSLLGEIAELQMLNFREVFDDSGTFPDGEWLRAFCHKKIGLGLTTPISCNMRIDADVDFDLMKRAGFRMLLFGVESANQSTLDRINKGINADDIIPTLKAAAKAGLEPHATCMLGQPGESKEEERRTIELVHYLLIKGYAKTAQASVYRIPGEPENLPQANVKDIYKVAFYPEFWWNQLKGLKSWDDVKYLFRGIREGLR